MTKTTASRAASLSVSLSTTLRPFRLAAVAVVCSLASLAGCGGGGNPLDNADTIDNPSSTGGRRLSFLYFQYCVNPIFDLLLPVRDPVTHQITSNNTCSSSGCHAAGVSTGGALTLEAGALPLAYPTTGPLAQADIDALRAGRSIYRNFVSAQAVVVIGSPAQSLLINKPRVNNVLHGGGVIFETDSDPHVQTIRFWLQRPMPEGQDEFSRSLESSMFAGGVASPTTCLTN